MKKSLISKQDFETTEADYKYNLNTEEIYLCRLQKRFIRRGQAIDAEIAALEQRMMQSLEGAGKILENLIIRAPIDGQLSRPQLDPGQSYYSWPAHGMDRCSGKL